MQHILIVEDDPDIQELLKNFLLEAGYTVTLAGDGAEAIALFSGTHFDLILLDIMLPQIDGFTVCELIRRKSRVPVIMLTALNGEEEQIRGLDLEVDDYITKPFSMPILIRKIGAVLRRSSMAPGQEHRTITYKNLVLDLDSYTAAVDGVSFELTQREFEVLRELLTHQGRVLTGLKQSSDADFHTRTQKQEALQAELKKAGITAESGSFEQGDPDWRDDSLDAYSEFGVSYDRTSGRWMYGQTPVYILYDRDHCTFCDKGAEGGVSLNVVRDKDGNIEKLVLEDREELEQFVK